MLKKYIILLFILIPLWSNAQIFKQDFNSSSNKADYTNLTPAVGELSGISNSTSVQTSITNGALRFTKTGVAGSYFYRTPRPVLTPTPTFTQMKFDFEASNNDPSGAARNISFYFGPDLSTSGTSITTVNSRFGLGISTTPGNFYLRVLDRGSDQSADFSGKQTITHIVNNSGSTQTYEGPDGSTESIANDTWEIWVGNQKIFNDVEVRNPSIGLSGFKMQYNSSLPNATLDFDNFEYKDLLTNPVPVEAVKSLVHPHIWVKDSDKQGILDNIANYDWAKSLYDQLLERNDSRAVGHISDPAFQLSVIPSIPGDRTQHRARLNVAVETAILYYLTDDEKYAQLSADFLHKYVKMISVKNPLTFQFYTSGFNHLIQTREHFPRVAMTYDLIFNFLAKEGVTVYDDETNTRVPFDFDVSQKAFEVMANNVIEEGGNNSNHPVLELPGALYSVLCMEDDAVRAVFFDKLMNGAANSAQPGINWMIDRFSKQGLWPESVGYGKFTHAIFLLALNVVDIYQPDLNLIDNNKELLESIFVYENILYPNGKTVAFGDINRDFVEHGQIFRTIMQIADRKGYTDIRERAASTLKKIYKEDGGYQPELENQRLEWNNPLQLLWGLNINESISDKGEPTQGTTILEHAGAVVQRNDVENNNEEYGLMYYTAGGTYVHAHADGLDMEIYGAGYIIGPDFGGSSTGYGTPLHEEYAVSYSAHNTIIVNATSGRGPKTNGNTTWQNIVDPIVLEASEPKPFQNKISNDFSFSTQFFDDNINNVDQQRTNGIIRTSPTSGYYLDIFRSISNTTNNFHDYLFHGLGDNLNLSSNSQSLSLTETPERYQNDVGDDRKQPGWRYFSEAKTSGLTNENVEARFFLNFDNKYLHVSVPDGIDREYSTALSPPTQDVSNLYDRKDTQVFVMRKYGEAWDKPFVALYEPSGNATSTITSSEHLYQNDKVVGVKVVSNVNGQEIIDYILSNDKDNETIVLTDLNINFTGRFGIIRAKINQNTTDVTLYIGEGEQLTFRDETLVADTENKGIKNYSLNFNILSNESFDKDFENVIAYPNPTNGAFQVTIPSNYNNVNIELYNTNLQLISSKTYEVKNQRVQFSIKDKAKGIYFLKINLNKPKYIKILRN